MILMRQNAPDTWTVVRTGLFHTLTNMGVGKSMVTFTRVTKSRYAFWAGVG